MSISMPKTIKEELLRWVMPIVNKEIKLSDVAKISPYYKLTLKSWKKVFEEYGEERLEPKSTTPKSKPNETPIRIKEEIILMRKKKKNLCSKITLEVHQRKEY